MNKRKHQRAAALDRLTRPGLGTLLADILQGMLSSLFSIPVIITGLATVLFHVNNLPHREYATMAFVAAIVITGVWRGCSDWQQARNDYQRDLARLRRKAFRGKAATADNIPGFVPFYRN